MARAFTLPLLIGLAAVGGCAVGRPAGPMVMALPAQGKDLAQFQREDNSCHGFAQQQIGTSNAWSTAAELQQRYDIAYSQCMIAAGNSVQPLPYGPYGYVAAWSPYYESYYGSYYGPLLGTALTLGFVGSSGPHFHNHFAHNHFAHHGSSHHAGHRG